MTFLQSYCTLHLILTCNNFRFGDSLHLKTALQYANIFMTDLKVHFLCWFLIPLVYRKYIDDIFIK